MLHHSSQSFEGLCLHLHGQAGIVLGLGGPQGQSWTGAENPTPTRIRSPDPPACSESLYQLRYAGPFEGEGI